MRENPDDGDESFEEVWRQYFAAHPEVRASWRHQNGYLPMGSDPVLDHDVFTKQG
jgi:hypothetical protein